MNFKAVKLKDISKNNRGYYGIGASAVDYDCNKLTYLRITDIKDDGTLDKNSLMSVDDKDAKDYLLEENDIVFARTGASTGRNYFYDGSISNLVFAGFLIKFSIDDCLVNPKFIKYYCLSQKYKEWIQSSLTGSTRPNINEKQLSEMPIMLPNREYQNKVVSILESITRKIELNNQINDNLQKLLNKLFSNLFVDFASYKGSFKESELGMIPDSYDVAKLGDIVSFSNGYGWNSKDMQDCHFDDSIKIFKMGNINIGGGINKEKTKSWISMDKTTGLEQYITKKGDILMCMTDMKNSGNPLLGHTALIDRDGEFVINQRVGIIRCNKDVGYSYVYTMSNLPEFIKRIRSKANSGVQVNLTTKGICDTLIVVPDKETQIQFEKIANSIYERIFLNNNEIENLSNLRDILLPKLMNGEIDLDKVQI